MKRYLLYLPILLVIGVIFMAQSPDEPSPRWIIPQLKIADVIPVQDNYVHPVRDPWVVQTDGGSFVVSPNIRVRPTSVTSQTEVVLVSHPTNPNILFGSSNAARLSGGSFINEGVYVSTNGGLTWTGSDTVNAPNLNDQRGDPGPTIDKNGRFIQTHLTSTTNFGGVTGMGANYSTNNGLSWSSTFQVSTSSSDDKNLACSDNVPSSPYYGNSYMTWCRFVGSTAGNSWVARTTDGGVTWGSPIQINSTPAGHFAQGNDIRVGPGGVVYATWVAEVTSSPYQADYMGFAKSTNGGVNWTATENAVDMNGSRSFNFGGWGTRVNDFMRMDVDVTGGPRNGWIYAVNTQNSLSPAGSDPDIILSRSTDGGTTWTKHRVNQDALNNGKNQWFPVVEVDDGGAVNVIFLDNRNFPNADSCGVWISRSLDGGTTWTDFEISDHHFKPIPEPGFSGGYYGDYIGLTSSGGKLHAFWMDNKAGLYNAWYCNVTVANNPLNSFNLQTPSAGVTVTTLPGSSTTTTFTWDTSATGASYKWIFGTSLPTRQITQSAGTNNLTMTLGQLDNILANLGVSQGGQLVGSWDVWAFRPNPPANDSLKATNGPRSITLRRGTPALNAFNLVAPANNTTITTSGFNNSNVNFQWTRSGSGTNYKWKFGSPTIGTVVLNLPSNTGGTDSLLTLVNSGLDVMLGNIGLNPGDSLVGQWAVWAYNATDSLKSTQTYNLTLKRQAKGDVLIAYDSTQANCRVSRDSVISVLNLLGVTYDLYNRGVQASSGSITFRGYKKVIVLGEGTSSFNTTIKDSLISYSTSGGTTPSTKAKIIIFSEDVGYNYARSGSTYQDLNFTQNILGFDYIADRPTSGAAQGLIGDIINPGMRDSTYGAWPEVIKIHSGTGTHTLDRFRVHSTNPDSANGVGSWRTNYNVAVLGLDVESLRNSIGGASGSPVYRFVKGAMDYVDQTIVGIDPQSNVIPDRFSLYQNYPNPFNPSTTIKFDIPKQSIVTMKIYDIAGREVARLLNSVQYNAGAYAINFDASYLASGVYFYRIEAGDFVEIKKMMLIK